MDWETIEKAKKFIETNLGSGEKNLVQKVSEYTNYSTRQLDRIFNEYTELTVAEYIRRRRISAALFEAFAKKIPINVIAHQYNYEATAFTHATKAEFGFSPREYLRQDNSKELFPPIDLIELKHSISIVEDAINSLADKGLLKILRKRGSKVNIKLEHKLFKEMSQYLKSLPSVPIPIEILNLAENTEQLTIFIGLSLYEFMKCQYCIEKMEWNPANWKSWCNNPSDELLMILDSINEWYSLENVYSKDDSNIVWVKVDPNKAQKIHLLAVGDKMNRKPFCLKSTEEEFGLLLDSAYEEGLVCYTGRQDTNKFYIEFLPGKLLAYIKQIGKEVYIPAAGFSKLAPSSRALLVIFGSKLPNFNGKINIGNNELIIKMFLVNNFYNIESPEPMGNQLKVQADEFIINVLESLIELAQVCGEEFQKNLSYEIKKLPNGNFELKIDEIFQSLALDEGLI
ncbi:hypothetical protein KL86SPO_50140 [uncultured Sporomusa sp.]|uniref:HTH araC/xylS-type domain-containing protein n=1 Tax=uncultured Sporomusa sp. TaxID=307249 RepID=A0A212LY95_9FIRM|nr:AraC family transcriptional regulator [uncultured Sporomusa sp.]SCM82369.1 hypothetical protein KL86SPO_50140 [uncultured Sporomusa sp.]